MVKLNKEYKVIILTGSRAEYSLLRPLIKKIDKEKNLKNSWYVQVCICHLSLVKLFMR